MSWSFYCYGGGCVYIAHKKAPDLETLCSIQKSLPKFCESGAFQAWWPGDLSTRAVTATGGLSTTPGNGGGFRTVGIVLQTVHDNQQDNDQPEGTGNKAESSFAHGGATQGLTRRRIRTPMMDPAKASANQTQPCMLAEAMPPRNAPTLHPKAIRAL